MTITKTFSRVATLIAITLCFQVDAAASGRRTTVSEDEMTGEISAFAISPRVRPTKAMSFPYHDIESWIGVGCDSESQWVFFGFSDSPNLTGTETMDGFNHITTRVKWDDEVKKTILVQVWGSESIHFRSSRADRAVNNLISSSSVLLELDWYGNQSVYFRYPLNGSASAITTTLRKCGLMR